MTGQRQRHQHRRQHRIGRAHHREQVAVADAVADHAEHRRHQRADIAERSEHREQQHRSGLDQHIPAENQRLHLERPGGEQIGRPLEAVVPDAKGSERGRPRNPLKTRCRGSSRSTLPCFLLCWGVSSVEANSQTCKQVHGDIHRVNNAATEVKPGWRSDCGSLAPPDVAALNAGCDAAKSRRQHRPALLRGTHAWHTREHAPFGDRLVPRWHFKICLSLHFEEMQRGWLNLQKHRWAA